MFLMGLGLLIRDWVVWGEVGGGCCWFDVEGVWLANIFIEIPYFSSEIHLP